MAEESKLPPPSIKTPKPSIPPVTTVDMGSLEATKPQPKETESEAPDSDSEETTGNKVEADFMKRFLGVLIDAIVIFGITSLVKLGPFSTAAAAALWLIRDSLPFLNGQSLGKLAMKTKAVKEDGSSLAGDWKTGAIRNILFVIPFAGALVEAIVFLTRQDGPQAGLRLGDEWAKTKVISVSSDTEEQ